MKEEIAVPGAKLKLEGVETDNFKAIITTTGEDEIFEETDLNDTSNFFYCEQSPYNMEGESLW